MSTVAVVKCASYSSSDLDVAIARGIDSLGGPAQFMKPGEKLLLKPNVLLGTDPARCVVTNPAVLKSVALYFRNSGAALSYGDSPAAVQSSATAMAISGYKELAAELKIELGDFDHGKKVPYHEGRAGKMIEICNAVFAVDGIVNLPKLKTHGLTRFTGAVKNVYGCVPHMSKVEYHARFPNVFDFSRLLVDICAFVHPRLHIMDAIIAMEGNGPRNGKPRKLGLLLFSSDPVALDATACRIINLNPEFVPTNRFGEEAALGVWRSDQIHIAGEQLDGLICKTFDVVREPPIGLARGKLHHLKSLFVSKPYISAKHCTLCSLCVKACPAEPKAVDWRKDPQHRKPPTFDYRQCIRCYCCSEVCPSNAIRIKMPLLRKLLPLATYISLLMTRSPHTPSGAAKK